MRFVFSLALLSSLRARAGASCADSGMPCTMDGHCCTGLLCDTVEGYCDDGGYFRAPSGIRVANDLREWVEPPPEEVERRARAAWRKAIMLDPASPRADRDIARNELNEMNDAARQELALRRAAAEEDDWNYWGGCPEGAVC